MLVLYINNIRYMFKIFKLKSQSRKIKFPINDRDKSCISWSCWSL